VFGTVEVVTEWETQGWSPAPRWAARHWCAVSASDVGHGFSVCSFRFWCGARLQRVQFSACGVGHGFCVCSSPLVVWRTASAVRAWTTNGYARCCR